MELTEFKALNPPIKKDLLRIHLKSSPALFESWVKKWTKHSKDIDFVYPNMFNKTLLEVACCNGQVEHVKILLKYGADPNRLNERNSAPIHSAAWAGDADVLQVLLHDERCNPNLEINKETALKIAVYNDFTDCVRVLLEYDADPNIMDSEGLKPIYIAARRANREVVKLILEMSKFPPELDDLHDLEDGGKLTTRQILQTKFPDIELPSGAGIETNIYALFCPKVDESDLVETLRRIPNYQITCLNFGNLMMEAIYCNFGDAFRELFKKGRREYYLQFINRAIHVTVINGYDKVLNEMLTIDPKLGNTLLLSVSEELDSSSSVSANRFDFFDFILRHPNTDVRYEDERGNTPLHYAAREEQKETVRRLLDFDSFLLGHRNVLGEPPLAHMSPGVLSDLFDDCICIKKKHNSDNIEDNATKEKCHIEFDYRYLAPVVARFRRSDEDHESFRRSDENICLSDTAGSEMEVLAYIAENCALQPLLKHPLLSSYLNLKWHRIRYRLYGNFVFYVIFYTLINVYILSTNHKIDSSSSSSPNSSNLTSTVPQTNSQQLNYFGVFTAIFLVLLGVRETFQLISSPGHYLSNLENILELVLVGLGVWTFVAPNPQISAIVILLSAWELVSLMGQYPYMSTGIEMLKIVTLTFLRFFLLYAILIVAFALAFTILFSNTKDNEDFLDVGHSLFKTVIMLTGEYDTNDIPFVSHPVLSRCIFVLFVFFIAIVMLNLLNGLAVSDTTDILNKSEVLSLISRVKSVSYFEGVAVGLGLLNIVVGRWYSERAVRRFMFKPPAFFAMKTVIFSERMLERKIYIVPDEFNKMIISETNHYAGWAMDPLIVRQAREIISRRESQRKASMSAKKENKEIIAEFDVIKAKFERLERAIYKSGLGNVIKSENEGERKSEG